MRKRRGAGGLVGVLLLGAAFASYMLTPTVHSGSPTEVPELGRPGKFAIATTVETLELGARGVITATSTVTGNTRDTPRSVRVRAWYPTAETEGETAEYERDVSRDPSSPLPVVFKGVALESAPALTAATFPLVVMSHGYGGWAEHFSFLGEHIASHGYVVASIDHADARPDGALSFLLSFGNVLQNRALDQRQVINQLLAAIVGTPDHNTSLANSSWTAGVDPEKIAVIGYSMGGYGALRTAGAPYNHEGAGLANLPQASKEALLVRHS